MAVPQRRHRAVIFELGGVLIQRDPRLLYRKLFAGDDAAMEHFLATVCTSEWIQRQEAGRSFAAGVDALRQDHPDQIELIEAFGKRFDEMIQGAIEESVGIVAALKERGVQLYVLANWSAETFPSQRQRFEFLSWFDGIVVSGEEGVAKPDPRAFNILLRRYRIMAQAAVFVDAVRANAVAAAKLGLLGLHYQSPHQLRQDLVDIGLL